LLATISGFCWGMWQEVGSHPEAYRHRQVESDRSTLELWSIKAGHVLADWQLGKLGPPDAGATAWAPTDNASSHGSGRTSLTQGSRKPRTPIPPPRDSERARPLDTPRIPRVPDLSPDTDATDPDTIQGPSEADLVPPKLPHRPAVEEPALPPLVKPVERPPDPVQDGLNRKSRELLERGHKAYDIASQHHQKAMPNAPNRQAALRQTIAYMKEAKRCYEEVLNHRPSKQLQRRIENRLVDINGILYWAHKHLIVR